METEKIKIFFKYYFVCFLFLFTYFVGSHFTGLAFDVGYLILFFVITVYLIFFNNVNRRGFDLLSPTVAFPAVFFLLYGIGSFRWIFVVYEHNVGLMLNYACLGMLSFLVGVIIVSDTANRASKETILDPKRVNIAVFCLVSISLVGAFLFVSKAGIPLLKGGDITHGRLETFKLGSNQNLYLARLGAIAFVSYFAYILFDGRLLPKNKLHQKLWGRLLFVYAVIIMIGTAARHDAFFLVFMIFSIFYYYKKINTFKVIAFLVVLTFLPFVYGYVRLVMSDSEILDVLYQEAKGWGLGQGPLSLLLMYVPVQLATYPTGVFFLLDLIPRYVPHFWGDVLLTTLKTFLPGEQMAIGKYIASFMGDAVFRGINPTMVGELYMEGGVWGICFGMFFYGLILSYLYVNVLRKKNTANVLFYCYMLYCLIQGVPTGFLAQAAFFFYWVVFVGFVSFCKLRPKYWTSGC